MKSWSNVNGINSSSNRGYFRDETRAESAKILAQNVRVQSRLFLEPLCQVPSHLRGAGHPVDDKLWYFLESTQFYIFSTSYIVERSHKRFLVSKRTTVMLGILGSEYDSIQTQKLGMVKFKWMKTVHRLVEITSRSINHSRSEKAWTQGSRGPGRNKNASYYVCACFPVALVLALCLCTRKKLKAKKKNNYKTTNICGQTYEWRNECIQLKDSLKAKWLFLFCSVTQKLWAMSFIPNYTLLHF